MNEIKIGFLKSESTDLQYNFALKLGAPWTTDLRGFSLATFAIISKVRKSYVNYGS